MKMQSVPALNPNNEGSYDLITDVELQDKGSAYARQKNAEGHNGHPLANVAHAYDRLARSQIDTAEPIRDTIYVPLFWCGIEDGRAVLKKRGLYAGLRQYAPVKTGRFHAKLSIPGPRLLDQLFRGEKVDVRDERIWDALVELVDEHIGTFRDGDTLKKLNNAVALLVLLRSGVAGNVNALPRIGGSHDRHPS